MISGRNRVGAVAASIVLLVVALVGASLLPVRVAAPIVVSTGGPVQTLATSGINFDYVMIILMENHNICDIYTHCGGTGTYMTALADAYSIARQDNYCNVNPSLPNYLCLSGATDFGCSGYDGGPNSNPCTNSAWNSPNIIDRILGAGLTWKAYMEDMPSNCYTSDSGNYAVRHNPFVYYNDIVSNSTRCNKVVPAGTAYSHYSVLSTIESNWNLPSLTTNDQNATNMNEFFTTPTGPDFSLSANPSTVAFVAGQSATSTISLHPMGGFNGTVALNASSSPSGITSSCVPSNISGSQSSTCTFTGSATGSYTVTITGTSGSLVHTTSIGVTVTAPPIPDFSIAANPTTVSFVAGESPNPTTPPPHSGGIPGTGPPPARSCAPRRPPRG